MEHKISFRNLIIVLIAAVTIITVGAGVFMFWRFFSQPTVNEENTKTEEVKSAINDMAKIVSALAGFSGEKTYLLLFQNNAELRPTGGFIGSFGVVTTENGAIKNLITADSYALDKLAEKSERPLAPEPMRQWNAATAWYFRDANWDPDFPASAQMVLDFFQTEQQQGGVTYAEQVDGVIALTPVVLERLLEVLGPVKIGEKIFTAETFHQDLQIYVERDYVQEGLPQSERKAIIGEIAAGIMDKLKKAGLNELARLGQVFLTSLQDRHILLWFRDPVLENIAQENNWGGQIRTTEGDYLFFVDANLASLKTDPVVERNFTYHLAESDQGLLARFDVDYYHTGSFTFTTTRLRSFARLYVPEGSQLIRVIGAEDKDRSDEPGKIFLTREHGKEVFGAFVSVEPGERHRLSFIYKLPDRLRKLADNGKYNLLIQKQAGTKNYPFSLDFAFKKKAEKVNGILDKDYAPY